MNKVYTIMFYLSISLALLSMFAFWMYGLNLGVDFKGGSILELEFKNVRPEISEVQKAVLSTDIKDVALSPVGEKGLILKMTDISEKQHQAVLDKINGSFEGGYVEKRFDSVGPVIGKELKDKSMVAIVLVLLAIIIYIAIVFRKMSVVMSSWSMGVAAIAALFHDIIIPIGVFSVLGHFYNVEISAVFVAAILTILGYSVSDTVVIFDRVRENVIRNRLRDDFGRVVHKSIMQTLTRSLNTAFTTLLSLIAIFMFGGESLRYFSLALIIGVTLGAYSSIFVASPLLVWWADWNKRS